MRAGGGGSGKNVEPLWYTFHVMDGDIVHMFGDCQDAYQHCVWKAESPANRRPRASIVFKTSLPGASGKRGHGLPKTPQQQKQQQQQQQKKKGASASSAGRGGGGARKPQRRRGGEGRDRGQQPAEQRPGKTKGRRGGGGGGQGQQRRGQKQGR